MRRLRLPRLLLWLFVATLPGCDPAMHADCRSSTDCPAEQFCRLGECTDFDKTSQGELIGTHNGDAGSLVDVAGDADDHTHPCPDATPASADNIVLNEFLANVPPGDAGDANDDGTRHYHDDEFVELVNTSTQTVEMTGVTIIDGQDPRFTFDEICVPPLNGVVVFGGIEPGATPPEGDDFQSFVSDTWFRFAQNGGQVVIRDAAGDDIADIEYGTHPDGSLNLDPDLDGSVYRPHSELSEDGELFSPGRCYDGSSLSTGCDTGPDNPYKHPPDGGD